MRFGGHKSWPIMRQIMDDLKFLPKKNPKNFLKKFCIRFGEKDFLEKLFNQFFDKNSFWGHKSWPEMWPIMATRSRRKMFGETKVQLLFGIKFFFSKQKKMCSKKINFTKVLYMPQFGAPPLQNGRLSAEPSTPRPNQSLFLKVDKFLNKKYFLSFCKKFWLLEKKKWLRNQNSYWEVSLLRIIVTPGSYPGRFSYSKQLLSTHFSTRAYPKS